MQLEREEVKVRGRRPKVAKAPTRLDRSAGVRQALISLPAELEQAGFDISDPGPVKTLAEPLPDRKTGGSIAHVEEPLANLLRRVSIEDNFSQRPPFDHVMDPIYRRLMKDFIEGAAMPESKIAALSKSGEKKAKDLHDTDVYHSIIDGLQRQYCYGLSTLLVWRREENVKNGIITQDAWEYFKDSVVERGDSLTATKELLRRTMRYEMFYNIDLAGLLHYMVTFNTAQRRMSLDVQLEIMRAPLTRELEGQGIPVYRDLDSMPGGRQPKEKFAAADLILATQAFITNNPQVSAGAEAERIVNESQAYLDNIGDVSDVAEALRRITTEIHPTVMSVYADDPSKRFMLSSGVFLLAMSAACGHVRNRGNMKMLDGALDKLAALALRPQEDPLGFEEYQRALQTITTSRGKAIRRLVYDTFLRFFNGATAELEWSDTARQITG